eukprot:17983_5
MMMITRQSTISACRMLMELIVCQSMPSGTLPTVAHAPITLFKTDARTRLATLRSLISPTIWVAALPQCTTCSMTPTPSSKTSKAHALLV